jgi:hypothetical protein
MNKDVVLDFWRTFGVSCSTQGGIASAELSRTSSTCRTIRASRATSSSRHERSRASSGAGDRIPFASSRSCSPRQAARREDAVVARSSPRSVQTGDTVDLKPVQEVGDQAQGPQAGAVRGRRQRRGDAQDRVPGRATSRASTRRQEHQAGARLRPVVVAVPRQPARPRRQRPRHGPVRHDDADLGATSSCSARRPLRAAVRSPARSSCSRTRSTG